MAYDERQKRASIKYMTEHTAEIRIRVRKERRDRYKSIAGEHNQSISGYFLEAVEQRIRAEEHNPNETDIRYILTPEELTRLVNGLRLENRDLSMFVKDSAERYIRSNQ